jgi:DNA polymerase III subunit epsilon
MPHSLPLLSTELLDYYRQASLHPFTVVDVETTGFKPDNSRVIEVSVIQATLDTGIQHQETHLINPGLIIPEQITRVTGISQAMITPAETPVTVWQRCLPLLNLGTFTAHNLSFDYGFITSEYRRLGMEFSRPQNQQLCTVILSRLMLPELPSRSLPNLVQHFGFAVGRSHRAAADTQACWLLAQRLLTDIQSMPDVELLSRFEQQWLPLGDAAVILQCSGKKARSRLNQAGFTPRLVGRYNTAMYRRGDIERCLAEAV